MSTPNLWELESLLRHCKEGPACGLPDGRWVPARPLGFESIGSRLRLAWLVFTGRADALTWTEQ